MKKNFLDKNGHFKKCCLNCNGFAYWDGDFCCTMKMLIHQHSMGHSGYPWMNQDIDNTMQTPETCEDYDFDETEEKFGWFKREYTRWKTLERLEEQLHNHVTNKWTDPQVLKQIQRIHDLYFQ